MGPRIISVTLMAAALAVPMSAQIATSNEKGATGAYSSEVDSSFTTESRFGPRTAIDDLRANVDRDREQVERLRMNQLHWSEVPVENLEPFMAELALESAAKAEADAEATDTE